MEDTAMAASPSMEGGEAGTEAGIDLSSLPTKGVTITPLSGPYPSPLSYQLTLDSALILLDCGAFTSSPQYSSSSSTASSRAATRAYLAKLKELAPHATLLLLSHPLLNSLGLLPWLRARCGLRCPVYATLPTREMGRWAVEEWVEGRSERERNESRENEKKVKGKGKGKEKEEDVEMIEVKEEEVDDDQEKDPWDQVWKVTTKEVRDAFLSVTSIRWTQPVHLSGALKGTTLTSHRSGHTLGGSLFTLRPSLSSSLSPASSSSSFLYAPIFNHVKEHHLDAAALLAGGGKGVEEGLRRMGTVVVGGGRSLERNTKRGEREKSFLDLITSTLRSSHSVLIPTDPSARLLELLILLETHWSHSNLGKDYPLVLITRTGKEVVAFLRSLTEWMGGQVVGEEGEKVLRFANLRIFPSISAMDEFIPPHIPKMILTTPTSLSQGLSRDIFVEFAKVEGNVVILTSENEKGSLGEWLWSRWNDRQTEGKKWGEGKVGEMVKLDGGVEVEIKKKVYLAGEELEDYIRKEAEAAEREAKHQALLERSRRMMQHDGDSDSDSDSEGEEEEVLEQQEMDGAVALVKRRRVGAFTGGAGAWDEFLDPNQLQTQSTTAASGGGNFDIYVKNSFAKKESGGGGYRMFPVIERKRRVDAYGEAIDVEGWLRRGLEEEDPEVAKRRAREQALMVGGVKRAREEEVKEEKEEPHKYVKEMVKVELRCNLFVVDMDGRTDGRALKTILPQINPRKLVIVDGAPEALADLANACRSVSSMTQEIYTPNVGETIKVGEETKNFSVRLGDSVMASLRLNRVDDYDVAFVSGIIQVDPESDLPVLERTALTNAILEAPTTTDGDPAAIQAEPSTSTDIALRSNVLPSLKPSLFIGDLKLTVLKDRLRLLNVPSEFAGEGILVCGPAPPESFAFVSSNKDVDMRQGARAIAASLSAEAEEVAGGKVAVRKMGRGRLVIEGSPGETFYVVRRIVYSLHASAS